MARTQYEYREAFRDNDKPEAEWLNYYGQQGWQVVSVERHGYSVGVQMKAATRYVLMRERLPKTDKSPE